MDSKPFIGLAQKIRPKKIEDIIGQDALLGPLGIISGIIKNRVLSSMIFWGPPGTGKTTLAQLLVEDFKNEFCFVKISAIFSGVSDLKKIFDKARQNLNEGQRTLLFIDEIHRFNKTQQDCLLPVIEEGLIVLIGATTENPSFALNKALLSRVRVVRFEGLSFSDLEKLFARAEQLEDKILPIDGELRQALIHIANGDARRALGLIETCWEQATIGKTLSIEDFAKIIQNPIPQYDKGQDSHYNLISALHKAIRGSDPDAALYYLIRMLKAGEDPLYLCRRLMRIASEDIGLADPQALNQACDAQIAYQNLGSPEGELAIAQACVYLASAPKSNALYLAYKKAAKDAENYGSLEPPLHILNAPTKIMKEQGYGKGYIYDHDVPNAFSGQDYFPESLGQQIYYNPVDRGFERELKKRLDWWRKRRNLK